MKTRIGRRVFASTVLVSLLVIAVSAATTRWSFKNGFIEYVASQEAESTRLAVAELTEIYERDGHWDALRDNPRRWFEVLERGARGRDSRRDGRPPRGGPPGRPPSGGTHPPTQSLDAGRVSLRGADKSLIIEAPLANDHGRTVPVLLDGETVAYLDIYARETLTDPADRAFARKQEVAILASALAALLIAAIVSLPLARRITQPVQSLVEGADAVTAGKLDTRIEVVNDDELGALAVSFNRLARTLEKNRDSRQRWVADIAHELRTPLAVLRGELDAIEDGVREFNDVTRHSLQAETQRLTKLIDDLHALSVYDDGTPDYHPQPLDIGELLQATLVDAHARLEDRGLSLLTDLAPGLLVDGDASRLEQLVTNLIENSIRYTDAPGQLSVRSHASDDTVHIAFADSAPGVPKRALEHVFDRLFRADQSRSRDFGGSGLGLSICKAIVESHGGSIRAIDSELGGLSVLIELPQRRST